jgi:hypothetical protein
MLKCALFEAAQDKLVGMELMHMLKKGQLRVEKGAESLILAEQFYALMPNHPTARDNSPQIVYTRKLMTEPCCACRGEL